MCCVCAIIYDFTIEFVCFYVWEPRGRYVLYILTVLFMEPVSL